MDPLAIPPARFLADLVCPERCAACNALVACSDAFCHACLSRVNVLGPPECDRCGAPCSPSVPCRECHAAPDRAVRYARAWAAYWSDAPPHPVAAAVRAYKYGGTTRLARRFALAMLPRVPDPTVSIVAPVPLHTRRLRTRGFNQSALLARRIARGLGCRFAPRLVARTRDTPSQTAQSGAARRANVADAFVVRRPTAVRDHAILVIDDVWTSGATAAAVAAALAVCGARAVDVLTFARVLAGPAGPSARAHSWSPAAAGRDTEESC
jgi:ComF family protein